MSNTQKDKAVDDWFKQLDHPLKDLMLGIREVILQADTRMSETIKWSTPTFSYEGNLLSIQPRAKQFVSLLVHRGSEIPGDHPILEGDADLVRTIRVASAEDLAARRADLEAVVHAWCDWRAGSSG